MSPAFKRGAVPIGDVIASVVRKSQLRKQDSLSRLEEVWGEVVGTTTANDTRLAHLRQGVLTVEVRTSGLAQELGVYLKKRLLAKLSAASGLPLKDLRCRVGGWSAP